MTLLVLFSFTAGCSTYVPPDIYRHFPIPPVPIPPETMPIEFVAVEVVQYADLSNTGYLGYLDVCLRDANRNPYPMYTHTFVDFHQLIPQPGGEPDLRLVHSSDRGPENREPIEYFSFHPAHFVHAAELANGSRDYSIHIWSHVLDLTQPDDDPRYPDPENLTPATPPIRSDLWINVTFTPLVTQKLAHHGAKDCRDGPINNTG